MERRHMVIGTIIFAGILLGTLIAALVGRNTYGYSYEVQIIKATKIQEETKEQQIPTMAVSEAGARKQITVETRNDTDIYMAAAAPEPVIEETTQETLVMSRDWGAEDSKILLKIAMAEAEGESTEGKALVMMVVLNRVWSDGFPNTIEEVVFQKSGKAYQFSPVAKGGRYWTTEPNEDCYAALEMVEHGWDESKGALYFEACKGESWHSRNLEYLFSCGNHNFYK